VLLLYFKYGRLLVILLQEVLFMQVLQVFCERFRQVEFTELQTTLIQLHKRTICKQFPLLLGDGSWVLSDVIEKGQKWRVKAAWRGGVVIPKFKTVLNWFSTGHCHGVIHHPTGPMTVCVSSSTAHLYLQITHL